ncbi:DUF2746 domain-containing protein [Leucobacter salsicius]|uniref:DUF2746 domain-containing protein n=1 Tax=Leucobacter salsicius TaxID=664638 RepID=UPI0003491A27|nr:DUF2746 domain-containing protein [Leucobacter salsicius]
MTEGVWIAIIGAFQAITLLVLQRVVRNTAATKEDTAEVKREVKNDHTTNLREEQDERHDEVMDAMRGMKKDIGRLDDRDVENLRHRRQLDGKFDALDTKFDEHLAWSREYVAGQEKT